MEVFEFLFWQERVRLLGHVLIPCVLSWLFVESVGALSSVAGTDSVLGHKDDGEATAASSKDDNKENEIMQVREFAPKVNAYLWYFQCVLYYSLMCFLVT